MDLSEKYKLRELRCISFCTGIRGLEKGMHMAGLKHRTVAYVEIEAFAVANLVAAMETGSLCPAPIWTNLKTFDAKPFRGKVDIFTGGYPCQPFSVAGQRKGTEDPRHLFPFILEHIRTIRPLFVFFENVRGHLKMGFEEVYRSLSDLGYQVECGIFSSEETGGSHRRERLFILGKLGDSKCNYERLRPQAGQSIRFNETSERVEERRNKLANPNSNDAKRNDGKFQSVKGKERLQQRNDNSKFSGSCEELVDTNSQGLQGYMYNSFYDFKIRDKQNEPTAESSRIPIARPGQKQFEWEHPRQSTKDALKSALGLPVDGYDYRTDFLRSLGNAVDPYAAKKALEKLMQKIEKS